MDRRTSLSGRCKSCDDILDEVEMTRRWPGSNDFCELCGRCLAASEEDYEYDPLDDFDNEDENEF
jgi:hypothetical protein